MKLGGLDLGRARIGLAIAEDGWVFGRGYLPRRSLQEDLEALLAFVQREGVELLVVGLPLRSDGREGPEAQAARSFAKHLTALGLKVELFDERLTTRLAQHRLLEAPRRIRRSKGKLDEGAAVILLEEYLKAHRGP
jgi:putative Holliday junction resolvase